MPAVRGDGMRGLAVFISDIRNCKTTMIVVPTSFLTQIILLLQVKVKKQKLNVSIKN